MTTKTGNNRPATIRPATIRPTGGRPAHSEQFVLIAVVDGSVAAEAAHAAAATRCEVVEATDPRDINRHARHAQLVIVDAVTAAHVAATGRRDRVIFVAAEPGPLDYAAAMHAHADHAFLLPAQAKDLLVELGKLTRPPAQDAAPTHTTGPQPPDRAHPRPPHPASHTPRGATPEAAQGPATIAVVGAGGGVGTSTFAAALARTAASARPEQVVVLIDAIADSGGLDLVMGTENTPGARWPELHMGTGDIDPADLCAALPATADGIRVLSAARSPVADPFTLSPSAIEAVADSLRRAPRTASGGAGISVGLTVIDADRRDIPESADHIVIVTAAEVRSTAVAADISNRLYTRHQPAVLAVHRRGWAGMNREDIENIAHADVAADIPHLRSLPRQMETTGLPVNLPRGLQRAANQVLQAVGWAS